MKKLDQKKIEYLMSLLQRLEYGSLLITVHANEITQVEIKEKTRIAKTGTVK
ncbi:MULTISPECIES: YezD family protein [Bacillaceae]|uniref:YezD family protein n=1 Tax=Metabacillus sediminis TaxID=3117746 RepID=A0ABZ2NKM4_9BACI|nr:YezD family protein [Bacillus sp. SJS]